MIAESKRIVFCIWIALALGSVKSQSQSHYNPTIIQDSRLEPKADESRCICGRWTEANAFWKSTGTRVRGTFGFKYRTEDGISHAAQGDPTGYIQGSYSYKDPTGLKVNFNYFAGARNNQNPAPTEQPQYRSSEPQYSPPQEPQQYYNEPDPYQQSQEYRPRTRPPTSYARPQYQPTYESRYTGSKPSRFNEVYDIDDYQYRG